MIQNINDPKYVDTVQLIKYAKHYDIPMTEHYIEATTQDKLWDLQGWLFDEILKKDPKFKPIEMAERRIAILGKG
jgi:hypothetical protein